MEMRKQRSKRISFDAFTHRKAELMSRANLILAWCTRQLLLWGLLFCMLPTENLKKFGS